MKILLVKPSLGPPTIAGRDFAELEPLELEYLAAGLHDHDCELVDLRFDRDLETRIRDFAPDVVAATGYSVHLHNALACLRSAKQIDPGIVTVMGGHHATLLPGDLQHPGVDIIVCGEGVFTFRELVSRLESGATPAAVPGLWYRKNGRFAFSGARNDIARLDELPFPDRQITRRHRDRYYYFWWHPAALVRASAGCAYRCSYCPIWKAADGRWRYRDPEQVAEELAQVREGFVYFTDDNMFFDRERMAGLHHAIERRGIRKEYFLFSRADAVVNSRDLVEKWSEIGLRQVFLGLEAVDVDALKPLNKRTDARVNEEAVAILKANGIDPLASFMVFPEFEPEDFDRIYDYVEKLGIYYCEYTVLTPAPGSELYNNVRDRLTTDDYRLFDYVHAVLPTRLPARQFYGQLARLYRRTYAPLRAVRMRPNVPPPLAPHKLLRALRIGLRTYFTLRNAHRTNPRAPDRLVVHAADTGRAARAFVKFPYQLYRDDARWVPPLIAEERKRWSPRHNPSLERRWVRRFIARRGGRVVGRVATIMDHGFAEAWEPDTGLFGFFECVEDERVARALLARAERALVARGAKRVLGPINLTAHDETGLLVDGHDAPATVMSPYNPPYYPRLLQSAGYEPYRDYQAFLATPDSPPSPAVRRIVRAAHVGRGPMRGVTLRHVDLKKWDRDSRIIFELYNAAFADVWGFTPIAWDEFAQRAALLRKFIRPELVPIAEVDGRPAGFGLTVPDINEALIHANGRLLPLGWLKIARRFNSIGTVRFIILAVRPEHVGRGIGALVAAETQDAARRLGYTHLDLSLVQEANHRVRRIIDAFGCHPHKTFRLYHKRIAADVTAAEAETREVACAV